MRTIGIFDFWKKRKQKSADFPKVAFRDLMDFLNIDPTSDRLSEATYLTCLKVLGEGLAKLPLALQMVTENGGVKDMTGLALWRTVKVRPNKYMSPTVFWTSVENNRNHFGNSYVWIDRKRNGSIELWVLPGNCVKIELDSLRDLSDMKDITYIYTSPNSGEQFRIASMDILHFRNSVIFDGLVGMSVREKLRASFDGAMMSQEMLNELYRTHFVPKAAIQFDVSSFVEKDLETQYLKSLQDYADGKSESGSSFIPLLPGTNIVPLNIKLTDGQFLELRKYSALQIAAAFGIKPNHLNDYDKSSYANSEAQQLAFYTDTMLYILKQYEEELNFKLLSEEQQKAGYRFKFNLAAVLRGDTKTQVESLSRGISSGLYTPDEARRNIDLPSKPGGDQLYFNGSNIPIVLSGTQYGNAPQKSVFTLANRGRSGIIEIRKKPVFGDGHRIADNEPDGNGGSGGGGSGGSSSSDSSNSSTEDSNKQPYNFSSKVRPEVREVFNAEYKAMTEKFGNISTISQVEPMTWADKNEYGNFNDNSSVLSIRFAEQKDCQKRLAQKAVEMKKEGMWSSSHPNHVIRHELGHAVQLEYAKNDKNWSSKLSKIQKIMNVSNAKDISSYGKIYIDEFVSECIAESMTSKPRKTARDVVNIILGE